MHILFLSHYYPPEVNAPASRTAEHCCAWVRAGHRVTVVTCAPNHPRGKVYTGYSNRLFQREIADGVDVIRLWTFMAANEGVLRRTLSYLSYFVAVTLALPRLPRPDVVVSTSPQFFCGLAGLLVRAVKGVPWVLEIRDLWPESIVAVGAMREGLPIRLLERLERLAYAKADRIVAVAQSYVRHMAARGGAREKITVVSNGVDFTRFKETRDGAALKRRLGLEGRFVAAYVGTHGLAHGLGTLIDAAEILRGRQNIAFLLVGDGAERERIAHERDRRGLANVVMLGQQPKEAMPAVWSASDAALVLLARNELFAKVLPSKMFEAMAMARPVVLGVEGEARAVVDAAGAGIAIEPENAHELAAALVRLAEDPALAARLGASGAAYARTHFDRAVLARACLGVLEDAVLERKVPTPALVVPHGEASE